MSEADLLVECAADRVRGVGLEEDPCDAAREDVLAFRRHERAREAPAAQLWGRVDGVDALASRRLAAGDNEADRPSADVPDEDARPGLRGRGCGSRVRRRMPDRSMAGSETPWLASTSKATYQSSMIGRSASDARRATPSGRGSATTDVHSMFRSAMAAAMRRPVAARYASASAAMVAGSDSIARNGSDRSPSHAPRVAPTASLDPGAAAACAHAPRRP